MGLFDIWKPSPYKKEIEDPEKVKKNYKYWRWRIFTGMYVGYIFYYFTRKSFTFAMPAMIEELGFSKSDLGIMGSVMAITYGLSKFLSGILSDKSNPRFFMGVGLILTGVFNIFFGMSSSVLLFAVFWGMNGWFQGWGWPPCARLLTHWYSQKERGTWWGFWNTSHSVGGALIPILAAFCAQYYGWRSAMYIPGVLCILVGFFVINRLRDTPQSLGLPAIEKFKDDYPAGVEQKEEETSVKKILFEYVLRNKYVWLLAVSYFFVYIVRTGINDWSALYLVEQKKHALMGASFCVTWFEIGGVFGSLSAGWLSDKIFQGKRIPVTAVFSFLVLFAISMLWYSPVANLLLDSVLMFTIGFFIFGPQMLIGMAAVEMSHKKAAGTASGFTGWIAYLGAAMAGYPLGKLTQELGWQGFFVVLGICSIASTLLLLPIWGRKYNPKYEAKEAEDSASLSETAPKSAT